MMSRVSPIRTFRDAKKITLQQFGDMVGLKKARVWKYENGRLPVPAELVPKIEEATGIPRHELRPDLWEKGAAA